jgi:hypothetical protein
MLWKYLAYAFVLLLYALFAWTGKVPASGFIVVLTGVISQLGAAHVYSQAAKNATDAANLANPVPPPNAVPLPTTASKE